MSVRVEHADMLEAIPRLVAEGVVCDAVVTDPPYNLVAMAKRFGPGQKAATSPDHQRFAKGFMGMSWDNDIAYRPETWATVATILRPGAFLVAFGGTRTHHRVWSAIEDGGFVIQDTIAWLFGCLDEQTEVATLDGVKPYHKVKVGDPVLCYDPATAEYSYQPALEVIEYSYDDTAYRLIGDFGEQIVSRNHRCIVERSGSEIFQLAETLERQARVPILESLPELQAALSGAHGRASQSQQSVRAELRRGPDVGGKDRRGAETAHSVRALWRPGERSAALSAFSPSEGLLHQVVSSASSCSAPSALFSKRERQAATGYGVDAGRAEPCMERRPDLSQSERSIRRSADPICALPGEVLQYGSAGRLRDGTSVDRRESDRPPVDQSRDGSSSESSSDGERAGKPYAVCNKRRAQSIRAWQGHRSAVVRVVPFRYVGKVWCLRVPTGAFVAVRNGVAFPTGNSGFPKRRDMLKPAHEPICLAYKPGGKRTMQIDECRIGFADETDRVAAFPGGRTTSLGAGSLAGPAQAQDVERSGFKTERSAFGRWPANVCHDGSNEVLAAFPDSAGQQGDVRGTEPSARMGENGIYGHAGSARPSAPKRREGEASADRRYIEEGASDFAMLPGARRSDAGSAARFFFSAKAGGEDRFGSRHPTVKPVDLIAWLVALVCPSGGIFIDPFAGSGTAAVAALKTGRNAILIEREEQYVADIRERIAFYDGEGRHSLASKARRAPTKPIGGLFDRPYDAATDSRESYDDAVRAIRDRVRAGEPVPAFLLPEDAAR